MRELRAGGAKLTAPAKHLERPPETEPSRQQVEVQRKIESARADLTAPLTRRRARPTTDSSEASSPAILGVLLPPNVLRGEEIHFDQNRLPAIVQIDINRELEFLLSRPVAFCIQK